MWWKANPLYMHFMDRPATNTNIDAELVCKVRKWSGSLRRKVGQLIY